MELESPPTLKPCEVAAILASTAGVFVASSVAWLVKGLPSNGLLSDGRLLQTIGLELLLGLWWVSRLRRRGWRLDCVTRRGEPLDAVLGLALAATSLLAYWLCASVVAVAAPEAFRAVSAVHLTGGASILVILVVAVLNPVFEEFLYLGFLANVLRREGMMFAVGASVVVRLAVHLYQGPLGVVSILPLGIVLGAFYVSTGRLWPTVIAHSVIDLVGLASVGGAA